MLAEANRLPSLTTTLFVLEEAAMRHSCATLADGGWEEPETCRRAPRACLHHDDDGRLLACDCPPCGSGNRAGEGNRADVRALNRLRQRTGDAGSIAIADQIVG